MTTLALEDMPNVFDMLAERNRRKAVEDAARECAIRHGLHDPMHIRACVDLAARLRKNGATAGHALKQARALAKTLRDEVYGPEVA